MTKLCFYVESHFMLNLQPVLSVYPFLREAMPSKKIIAEDGTAAQIKTKNRSKTETVDLFLRFFL